MTKPPRDNEIQAVMLRTGMDYLQARNHLLQQQMLQERTQRVVSVRFREPTVPVKP